jgi:glycosyltransferase involved in cell wall biosynthesis
MIFVGKPGWLTQDFLETFRADGRIKDHILLMSPDDEFLDVLYRNCRFTVLASMYEGWSLTLPESLSYGKFCLVAETPPLIETGRDLVEYINCYDTRAWADRIMHYIRNPKEVKAWETKIKRKWKSKTWETCAQDLLHLTMTHHTQRYLTTAE